MDTRREIQFKPDTERGVCLARLLEHPTYREMRGRGEIELKRHGNGKAYTLRGYYVLLLDDGTDADAVLELLNECACYTAPTVSHLATVS